MYEYAIEKQEFANECAKMKVSIVTAMKTDKPWYDNGRNSNFLYDNLRDLREFSVHE